MARVFFERQLFDLIETVSKAERRGQFARALLEGVHRQFAAQLGLVAVAEFQPVGARYEIGATAGEPIWPELDGSYSVRVLQRRLQGQLWWIQRGLKRQLDGQALWYDLILIPIGRDLKHILGLLTRSMSGDEGMEREASLSVLSQLIRLFVDRHHQQERLNEILALARDQQLSLLPATLPPVPGYEVAGRSIPAEEVGGDYYQVIPLSSVSTALAVADAKGHGFEAAVLATGLHAALRVVNETPFKVTHKLRLLNRSLAEKGEIRNLVSLFYGEFESEGRVIYGNCSHPPPFIVRGDGETEDLSVGGVFLGMDPDSQYRIGVCELQPGDLVVIYTDGWTELFNDAGEEFGPERMRAVVLEHREEKLDTIMDRIQQACDGFRGELGYDDDRTLLLARKR